MNWDYATLSMMAKKAGGPKQLLQYIEERSRTIGFTQGRSSMYPWLGLMGTAVVGLIILLVVREKKNRIRIKEAIANNDLAYAEEELIRGIQEYEGSIEE